MFVCICICGENDVGRRMICACVCMCVCTVACACVYFDMIGCFGSVLEPDMQIDESKDVHICINRVTFIQVAHTGDQFDCESQLFWAISFIHAHAHTNTRA